MTDQKSIIYMLMHHAFLDIRAAAYETKPHKGIFKLADVFHNVPLQLERVNKSDCNYGKILDDIRMRAVKNECIAWLDNILQQIQ